MQFAPPPDASTFVSLIIYNDNSVSRLYELEILRYAQNDSFAFPQYIHIFVFRQRFRILTKVPQPPDASTFAPLRASVCELQHDNPTFIWSLEVFGGSDISGPAGNGQILEFNTAIEPAGFLIPAQHVNQGLGQLAGLKIKLGAGTVVADSGVAFAYVFEENIRNSQPLSGDLIEG